MKSDDMSVLSATTLNATQVSRAVPHPQWCLTTKKPDTIEGRSNIDMKDMTNKLNEGLTKGQQRLGQTKTRSTPLHDSTPFDLTQGVLTPNFSNSQGVCAP